MKQTIDLDDISLISELINRQSDRLRQMAASAYRRGNPAKAGAYERCIEVIHEEYDQFLQAHHPDPGT